jgi:5-methylcytosine-specific restriction protein B
MAGSEQRLSVADAEQILDKNFNFRSPAASGDGTRSYRIDPNGRALDVRFHDGKVTVKLPTITQVGDRSRESHLREINSVEELISCIELFKKEVIRPRPLPSIPKVKENKPPLGSHPLNTILYGPPGTGKTFKTAELAVEICDGKVGESRAAVMARYEELRADGRINFTTFHQAYGYEDFIEGLRPESIDGQITYPVRPGVFRRICDASRRSSIVKPGLQGRRLTDRTIFKMSLGRSGTAEGSRTFSECIKSGYVLLGWGDHVDFSGCQSQEQIRTKLLHDYPDADNPESQARYVEVFKNEMKTGDIVVISEGNRAFKAIGEVIGEYEYLEEAAAGRFHQMRPVRWLAIFENKRDVSDIFDRNFMQSALYKLEHRGLKLDVLENLVSGQTDAGTQNFVLIIDEINRANISKVFGELITLLEADKREGEENVLTLKLPYSGDDFSVPPNLYLIGTMNTADRSIALLDTALRRRFDFQELQPNYAVLSDRTIDGVNLSALLAQLNDRIEYLYDRDHTIGHAYFMNVKTLHDLDTVFRRKVLPLLQEYFYEDWSKVRIVLNDQSGLFVEATNRIPPGCESVNEGHEVRVRYNVRSSSFPVEAYLNVYR